MMYQMFRAEDGAFVVTIAQPHEIARFASETHAKLFVATLQQAEPNDPTHFHRTVPLAIEDITDPTPPEPQVQAAAPAEDAIAKFRDATVEFVRPAMPGTEVVPAEAQGIVPEEPPAPNGPAEAADDAVRTYERAMRRIAKGEACKDVADDMGLPFMSLRGKWAASKPRVLADIEREEAMGEDVCRPDLVMRKSVVWTDAIDEELVVNGHDEDVLWRLAEQMGVSLERVRRRRDSLLEQVAKDMQS